MWNRGRRRARTSAVFAGAGAVMDRMRTEYLRVLGTWRRQGSLTTSGPRLRAYCPRDSLSDSNHSPTSSKQSQWHEESKNSTI